MNHFLYAYIFLLLTASSLPVLLHAIFYRTGVRILCEKKLVRKNYTNQLTPTSGGIFLVSYVLVAFVVVTGMGTYLFTMDIPFKESFLFFSGSVTIALYGWQDDRSTDKSTKGFHGHLRILVEEQRITSGLLKAVGIGNTAFIISIAMSNGVFEVLLHTAILALSCNFINLFDLQPGRAIKVFGFLFILLFIMTPMLFSKIAWLYVLPVCSSVFLLYLKDSKGQIMLGDTGSNYLGFLLGYASMVFLPIEGKVFALLILLSVTLLAERISFSQYIQSVKWLNRLDQWGRP